MTAMIDEPDAHECKVCGGVWRCGKIHKRPKKETQAICVFKPNGLCPKCLKAIGGR